MKNLKSQKFLPPERKEKLQNSGSKVTTKIKKRFFFRKEKKGQIVFDRLYSRVYFMNKTSAEAVYFFELGFSEKEIAKKISSKYEVSFEKALKGIKSVLEELK